MKNSNGLKQSTLLAALIGVTLAATGCGQEQTTGTTLKSSAFGAPGVGRTLLNAMVADGAIFDPSMDAALASVTQFSFCVTQLKLEGEGGSAVSDDDGDDLFEAPLGLIHAGDGSTAPTWGAADLPAGATVSKLKVEIHHDPEICGSSYSVKLNDQEITQDVEMVFAFSTPKTLVDGETLVLDLDAIVAAFSGAYDAGDFNDSNITSYINALSEGSASEGN